jgi:hypothetical protein
MGRDIRLVTRNFIKSRFKLNLPGTSICRFRKVDTLVHLPRFVLLQETGRTYWDQFPGRLALPQERQEPRLLYIPLNSIAAARQVDSGVEGEHHPKIFFYLWLADS